MLARAITRLASLFRGAQPHDRHRDEATFRQRLNTVRSAVVKWKARVDDLTGRVQALAARAAVLEQTLQRTRDQSAAARRERPSIPLVRQTFIHRVHDLPARVSARLAEGREDQLLRVSPAYRAALERGADGLDAIAHRMTLDGLTWRVPFKVGQSRLREGWIAKQRFPYHGILQTREVAGGGIMLDLGANVGRMAVPRVILGDVTVAYCAEPDPVAYACLARNVIDNGLRGLVLPDHTALGDCDGTVRLRRAGSSGNSHVVREAAGPADDLVQVPSATLDTWVERLGIDLNAVTFIKVDVEGFERRVLAGARGVLERRHIAWQMEVKPSLLRAAGDDPEDLYADLRRAFTHFIDLNRLASGRRVRQPEELSDSLRYIEPDRKTDVLLFSAA